MMKHCNKRKFEIKKEVEIQVKGTKSLESRALCTYPHLLKTGCFLNFRVTSTETSKTGKRGGKVVNLIVFRLFRR